MSEARYRARDLLGVPTLLSLSRIPLGALFFVVVARPREALLVLALAGLSDVLDGWWARRFRQVSSLGAVADGIADKVFALCVAAALWRSGRLGPAGLLLGVRDLGEVLLVGWTLARHDRHALHEEQRACAWGKATTCAQFAAVGLAAAGAGEPVLLAACAASAVLGLAAVRSYARRAREV